VNLFGKLFGRKASELTYDQVASLIDGTGGSVVAGVAVTDKTALQVSTVLACVKAIADGCATPDLHVFRELEDGTRQKAVNIPEYRLLARRPNEWQTSFEWRRQMTIHAALTGAALSIKVRGANRRVQELIPVTPGQWEVEHNSRYGVRYKCWDKFGVIGEFGPDDVFLLNNLQWDWVKPMNAVTLARAAIGLAMATERSQSAMHANGLRPSGTYTVEGNLNPEQHERLSAFLKRKSGPDNAGAPLILDRAAKWFNTTITGVDAQHVETRRLQIEEICRAYGVFPIMVGHSDKSATFASSEAFFSAHVKHTLAPWHRAWTQRIDEMLLDGSGPLYAEFDTRYLVAGDMAARAAYARTMVEMGLLSPNEWRDEEGRDPRKGGDEYLTPMNMNQGNESEDPVDDKEPEDDKQAKHFDALERKLDALSMRQQPAQPVNIELRTADIERSVKNAIDTMATAHADHIKAIASEMPINITMPEQPAPQVTVNVEAPQVTFEATMPQAQVVVNNAFPTKSVQTVERDANDEITRTVTTHEGRA
jgi:HK97 family phage portal protein